MFKEKFEDYWADMAKKSRNELMEKIESQNPDLIRQINRVEWVFRNKLTHLTWEDGSPITERDYTTAELARLLDPPFAPVNDLSRRGIEDQQQFSLYISQDPVLWSKHILGVEPRVYQVLMLRDASSRVIYRLGRRMGKCLDVHTPIPTPGGWKTMGQLDVGFQVYDEKAQVCNVIYATDYQYGHNCYEVTFADGQSIVTDEDHLWSINGSLTATTVEIKRGIDDGQVDYFIEGRVPAQYSLTLNATLTQHQIVDVKPVETRPVKCIKVDSESNLFLAGESFVPTHNTYTLAIKLLHHAWTTSDGGILVLAPMSSQVNLLYEESKRLASYSELVNNSLIKSRQTPYAEIQFSTGSAARFFTTGMKAGGKCLSPDHDVLTANGWRSIMNVHEGDRVLSWDGKNYVWKSITNTTSYHHEGDMVWVNRPDLSFFATPNHKFPVWWNGQWQMVEAQDLANEDQIPIAAPPDVYDPEFVDVILKHLDADEIPKQHFTLNTEWRPDAEFLQLCATAIGRYAKLRPWVDGWSVEVSESTFQFTKVGKTKTAYYQGPVFCIEVEDTHTFVARHNGTVFVTGNSDVARGQEAELIILDEMDYMGEDDLVAIYAILMPTREGEPEKSLVAASTPSGKHGKFREWSTNPAHGFSHHWYPSFCFTGEQKVLMADGSYKAIVDVRVNDHVQTEQGPKRVITKFEREYEGDIINVTTYGNNIPIRTTPEHPFAACKRQSKQNPSYEGIQAGYPWQWTLAQDLTKPVPRDQNSGTWLKYIFDDKERPTTIDLLDLNAHLYEHQPGRVTIYPAPGTGREFKNDFPRFVDLQDCNLAWLLGIYTAEGNLTVEKTAYDNAPTKVHWTLNEGERQVMTQIQDILDIFDAGRVYVYPRQNQHSIFGTISNAPLAILLQYLVGSRSLHKQLHHSLIKAPKEFQRSFLYAYAIGDGWERIKGSWDIRTSSEQLAHQVQAICTRLGWIASISRSEGTTKRGGGGYGPYYSQPSWLIEFNRSSRSMLGKRYTSTPGEAALLVKNTAREPFTGTVYNLEVEDTNTFIVQGVLVHNCNILMDKKTEDEQRAEYTENEFRREIEADWGEPAEGVYAKRHLDRAFLDRPWDYVAQRRHPDSDYYIGVDWDTVAAGPNIVVLEVLPENYDADPRLAGMLRVSFREEVDNQQDAPLTAATERIIELNQIFAPARIMIDKGYGTVQHEQLLQYGTDHPETKLKERLTGVSFSEKITMKDPSTREDIKKDVKPYMVNVLQHLFEQDMIFFPNTDLDLYNQLLGYIVLRVNESGRPIYEGMHSDHAHDALALACLGYNYDHDKLHAKPNVARRAAIARTTNSDLDDPDYPNQSRVAPMLASYGRRKQRAGAGVRKRKKF